MKEVNENTIGGRIRKARINCKLTTGELAKAVGVSQNYISVVERNDKKQASPALLRKISEVTGVSLVWLRDGDSIAAEATHFKDIQLLLAVIMQHEPKVTRETVASVLAVDIGTVDAILSGAAEYSPQWEAGISNLVQRLDLPAVRKKLRVLDAFLLQEEEKKSNAKLFWSFRKVFSKLQKCSFWFVGHPVRVQDEPEYTLYVLQGENGIEKWSILHYSSPLDKDEVKEAYRQAYALLETTSVAVAFSDKESYDGFSTYYEGILKNNDYDTSCDGKSPSQVVAILLLLVDGDTGNVIEKVDVYSKYVSEYEDTL